MLQLQTLPNDRGQFLPDGRHLVDLAGDLATRILRPEHTSGRTKDRRQSGPVRLRDGIELVVVAPSTGNSSAEECARQYIDLIVDPIMSVFHHVHRCVCALR